jgi:hypothetical protein
MPNNHITEQQYKDAFRKFRRKVRRDEKWLEELAQDNKIDFNQMYERPCKKAKRVEQ